MEVRLQRKGAVLLIIHFKWGIMGEAIWWIFVWVLLSKGAWVLSGEIVDAFKFFSKDGGS